MDVNEEACSEENFPPFSFSKKPIDKALIQNSGHSQISNMIPRSSYNGFRSKPKEEIDEGESCKEVDYNDVDYNEQIRAPWMNNMSQYIARSGLTNRERKINRNKTIEKNEVRISTEAAKGYNEQKKEQESYLPAEFDLSQPTRRSSTPEGLENNSLPNLYNYFNNSYLLRRDDSIVSNPSSSSRTNSSEEDPDKSNLMLAVRNLNNNLTSQERRDLLQVLNRSIKHRPNFLPKNSLSAIGGTELQQLYLVKKPLCLPAVLRRSNESTSPLTTTSTSSLTSEASPPKFNYSVNTSPTRSSDNAYSPQNASKKAVSIFFTPKEPTRCHWKPDNYSNHCMKCFVLFGNFFSPLRTKRHHCRFCGNIFCSNCLWMCDDELANLAPKVKNQRHVYLDEQARFVIPLLANIPDMLLSSMENFFKSCKVCRDCGKSYWYLFNSFNYNLEKFLKDNNLSELIVPFIFIESAPGENEESNAYDGRRTFTTSPMDSVPESSRSIGSSVPSDWTWSTF